LGELDDAEKSWGFNPFGGSGEGVEWLLSF